MDSRLMSGIMLVIKLMNTIDFITIVHGNQKV